MRTDEDLASITVGELRPLDGPVALAEYDPAWPRRYAALAGEIAAALGGRALRIEHVGSTSVPGLVAKPIIDVVLVVEDPAREAGDVPPLEPLGYGLRIREPGWYEHRMLKGGDDDVNLHVFAAGCPEVERMVRFRDRLRADPGERDLYAAVKRELAARSWRHLQDYADASGPKSTSPAASGAIGMGKPRRPPPAGGCSTLRER
jgi:GrpB-like predicted nucleotidyltransferase (UPF0157 family)